MANTPRKPTAKITLWWDQKVNRPGWHLLIKVDNLARHEFLNRDIDKANSDAAVREARFRVRELGYRWPNRFKLVEPNIAEGK